MHSRSRQSGKTSIATASRSPRGDARNPATSSGRRVTCVASPPEIGRNQTCGRSRARGKEIDAAAVGRPVGRAVVLLVARDAPGRRVAVELEQPQVGAAAVGGEVGFPQRVDDPLAVGRQRRLREPREADEVRRGQAVRRRRGDERNCRQGGSQQVPSHGFPRIRGRFYQPPTAALGRMRPNTLE